ncbi:ABC transporter ATP-binding protein [Streptomyces griseocarneus]|nr:ABC transporter ATP-binding protein [Streptomyces griseocarneus]
MTTTPAVPTPPTPSRKRRPGHRPEGVVIPRYTVSAERHDDALDAPWWTIARHLPRLAAIAIRLAWQAAPRAVALTCTLQLLSGAVTAIGLYATTSALAPLLASGPTGARVRDALPALAVVTLAACARSVVAALTVATTARIGPRVDGIAETRYLEATTKVPLAAYDDPAWCDQSEAASRAAKDVHLMVEAITTVSTAVLSVLAAAGVLAHLHPVLLPLMLLAVLPRGWAAVRAARAAYVTDRHVLADRRLRHSVIFETSSRNNALEVRAYLLRDWLLGRFRDVAARLEDAAAHVGATTARYQLIGDAVAGTTTAGVYLTLLWLTATGRIPPAAAGTAVIAVQTSQRLLVGLVQGANTSYKTGLYLGDWDDFLRDAETRTADATPRAALPKRLSVIEAKEVTFSYPGSELPALDRVSVRVRRGEVLAVVGANGSGKSTLAKILAGLYTPTAGAVHWDGVNLADADPEETWRKLAMLPQDFACWPVTARENITLGQNADDEAVMTAARAAGADTVIDALPNGLDTNLAPSWWGGRDLSGGQWQRIAGARAFYRHDADLLICDEPTAALDPRSEEAVYDRIRSLSQGRSVVLITHRLGSTRNADHIVVLDGGRVIEEGTHDSLMELDGEYAGMYRTQAQAYSGPVT